MLAGVLLHVIEAARPIDAAVNRPGLQFAIDDMDDFVAVVAHFEHVGVAKLAVIARLSARGRIQRRLIEHDLPRWRCAVNARLTRQHFALRNRARRNRRSRCDESPFVRSAALSFSVLTLQRPLPGFGVFISCAGIEEHDFLFGLDPAEAASLRAPLTVAAPSGAAKIPSCDANCFPAFEAFRRR